MESGKGAFVEIEQHDRLPDQPAAELPAIQPRRSPVRRSRLVVGAHDDLAELEADRVADDVVRQLGSPSNSVDAGRVRPGIGPGNPAAAADDRIRRKPAPVVDRDGGVIDSETEQAISGARGTGHALPATTQQSMEGAFGADFSQVRVHTGQRADELNRRIQARAFTAGNDVFFSRDAFRPASPDGQHLIAHELAHVVQQQPSVEHRRPDLVRRDFWERRPGTAAGAAGITNDDWHPESDAPSQMWEPTGEPDVRGVLYSYPVYRLTKKGLAFEQRLRDAVGPSRAKQYFAAHPPTTNAEFDRFKKAAYHALPHSASLRALSAGAFAELIKHDLDQQKQFFRAIAPPEFAKILGKSAADQKRMLTGGELSSFSDLASLEARFKKTDALPRNPKAAQGAHFLSEHGVHNSVQQTVILAADYAREKGKSGSKKGNWLSHSLEQAALQWAKTRVDLAVQQAQLADDAAKSTATLDAAVLAGPNLFITDKVRDVIDPTKTFVHGNTPGSGRARATLRGDFEDAAHTVHPDAVRADVTGAHTSKPAGGAAIPAPQQGRIVSAIASGTARIRATGTTAVAGPDQLVNGIVNAEVRVPGAHVTVQVGNNDTVDGIANVESMLTAPLATDGGKTAWVVDGPNAKGVLRDQKLIDGAGNKVASPPIDFSAPWATADGAGAAVDERSEVYVPGIKKQLRNGSNIKNLTGTLTLSGGVGAAFQPDTLKEIVENAGVTSRKSSYVKGNTISQLQLLEPSVKIEGTLGDLKAANLIPAGSFWNPGPKTVSSLNVEIENFARHDGSAAPDIRGVASPRAGDQYSITHGGTTYQFDLTSLDPSPTVTKFQVLLYLERDATATYTPFTAY